MPGPNTYDAIIREVMQRMSSPLPPIEDDVPDRNNTVKRTLYTMGLLKPGQPPSTATFNTEGMRPSTNIDDRRNDPERLLITEEDPSLFRDPGNYEGMTEEEVADHRMPYNRLPRWMK